MSSPLVARARLQSVSSLEVTALAGTVWAMYFMCFIFFIALEAAISREFWEKYREDGRSAFHKEYKED